MSEEHTTQPKSPFTCQQVKHLHQYQFGPWGNPLDPTDKNPPRFHPFTCPNRGDGNHFENGPDLGILIPTVNGWICQCCDYRQDWAHDFMTRFGDITQ